MRDDPQCENEGHQIVALIVQGRSSYHGVIRNLSAKGVMFEGSCPLVPGERVAVEFPGIGWIHATVAWIYAPRAGISFDSPLSEDKVDVLREQLILSIRRGVFPLIGELPPAEEDLWTRREAKPRIVESIDYDSFAMLGLCSA